MKIGLHLVNGWNGSEIISLYVVQQDPTLISIYYCFDELIWWTIHETYIDDNDKKEEERVSDEEKFYFLLWSANRYSDSALIII